MAPFSPNNRLNRSWYRLSTAPFTWSVSSCQLKPARSAGFKLSGSSRRLSIAPITLLTIRAVKSCSICDCRAALRLSSPAASCLSCSWVNRIGMRSSSPSSFARSAGRFCSFSSSRSERLEKKVSSVSTRSFTWLRRLSSERSINSSTLWRVWSRSAVKARLARSSTELRMSFSAAAWPGIPARILSIIRRYANDG